jgi:hypothetical protein
MYKIAKYAIAINLIAGLIFIYSNFALWSLVNGEYPYVIASHWSPLGIVAPHYVISDGSFSMTQTLYLYFNSPFWLFWVLMIANIFFILRISKDANRKGANTIKN